MSSSTSKLRKAQRVLSAVGSIAATAMVIRTIAKEYVPDELHDYISSATRNIFSRFSTQLTMVIDEFDGLIKNQLYTAVDLYLAAKISPYTHRLKVTLPEKEQTIHVSIERNEEISDVFSGDNFKWVLICKRNDAVRFHSSDDDDSSGGSNFRTQIRSFEVTFHRKNRAEVLENYLPFILRQAKLKKIENRTLKIFTLNSEMWSPVNLDHPATFETLAMEVKTKEMIMRDLERFVERREFYRKVGKAWKRGYLLYGPPGTGKSSLIAAMANYLKFDVYDLDLTEMRRNSTLRRVLLATANRSILVVEDIDCSGDFENRSNNGEPSSSSSQRPQIQKDQNRKVTLSGLLNFVDGLWSSCGDERIIIFTTNHKEKLDPALLRPGRMDVHIHMSYCTPCGFKILAANYLGIKDHKFFGEIEELISSDKVLITPAEVAEQLLEGEDVDDSLRVLIDFLNAKKIEYEEVIEAKKLQEASQLIEPGKIEEEERGIEENNNIN